MKGLDVVSSSPNAADRRRDVRIAVPSEVRLSVTNPQMQARALDVSEGGALIESNLPFALGPTYQLTFVLGSHVAKCDATAVHCRRLENGRFLTGLKLTPGQVPSPLADLIDLITVRSLKFS